MRDERISQKLQRPTMKRIDSLDFAKRNMSFDKVINRLIDEYENKKKK